MSSASRGDGHGRISAGYSAGRGGSGGGATGFALSGSSTGVAAGASPRSLPTVSPRSGPGAGASVAVSATVGGTPGASAVNPVQRVPRLDAATVRARIVGKYFAELNGAEAERAPACRAATLIQAAWRRHKLRTKYRQVQEATAVIQRAFRIHLARRSLAERRRKGRRALLRSYYDEAAVQIQRHYRGYVSRKYVHYYYARKRYLAGVARNNERIRAELDAHRAQLEAENAAALEAEQAAEIQRLIANSHHLISTKTQPGYYATIGATINNVPVEDSLRDTFKDSFRAARGIAGGHAPSGMSPTPASVHGRTVSGRIVSRRGSRRSGSATSSASGGRRQGSARRQRQRGDGLPPPSTTLPPIVTEAGRSPAEAAAAARSRPVVGASR